MGEALVKKQPPNDHKLLYLANQGSNYDYIKKIMQVSGEGTWVLRRETSTCSKEAGEGWRKDRVKSGSRSFLDQVRERKAVDRSKGS